MQDQPPEVQGSESSAFQVDSDWKAQAAAEKEKLQKQAEEKDAEQAGGKLPEASFETLVDLLSSQALSGLGMFADKASGGIIVDLPMAKLNIDLLDVIEKKTQGNLTSDEQTHLEHMLTELRARFVQLAQMIAQQGAGNAGVAGAAAGDAAAEAGGPQIEMP